MDFQPINTDHSVQSATFKIGMDGAIPASVIQTLSGQKELLADLPAVQRPEGFELNMTGSAPVPRRLTGIQFSHLRPDGSPAWALRLIGNELAVDCTRYTRWDKVWEAAERYLQIGLRAIAAPEGKRKVAIIGQNFVDAFVANRANYSLSHLLKPGDLLSSRVFSSGNTWHSHVGWLEPAPEQGIIWLNQVNVDGLGMVGPTSVDVHWRVQITHNQELRYSAQVSIEEASKALDEGMKNLHMHNKKILKELLASDMATRIGLGE
jgi:uncharacterized protein (TIGR04255 family)